MHLLPGCLPLETAEILFNPKKERSTDVEFLVCMGVIFGLRNLFGPLEQGVAGFSLWAATDCFIWPMHSECCLCF